MIFFRTPSLTPPFPIVAVLLCERKSQMEAMEIFLMLGNFGDPFSRTLRWDFLQMRKEVRRRYGEGVGLGGKRARCWKIYGK